jgi:serine/threonine protein kinase
VLTRQAHSFETDVWAFGVVLYELFTGERPLRRAEIEAIRNLGAASFCDAYVEAVREAVARTLQHKPEVCQVVLRCLEVLPTRRRMPKVSGEMEE